MRRKLGIPRFAPPFNWPPPAVALLGTDTDAKIAQKLGIHMKSVQAKRASLRIPRFDPKAHRWTDEMLGQLGKMTDQAFAEKFGLTKVIASKKRIKLGIASFKASVLDNARWSTKWLSLLGKIPDRELAEKMGYDAAMVGQKRRKMGIPIFCSDLQLMTVAPNFTPEAKANSASDVIIQQ